MHVCMLVTSNVIKDPRVQKEAQIAADHGMHVTVVGRADDTFDQSPLKERSYNVILIPIARKSGDSLIKRVFERVKFIWELYQKCLELKPDVIHANDFDTLPAAYYAGKRLGCPVVYDSHEIWTEQGTITRYPAFKKLVQQYEKYLMKRVAATISVSNAGAAKFVEMYGIKKPNVVTNCPYSFPERDSVTKNPGFEVIYHGIYDYGRGYEEYCLAAGELNDEEITLVLRGFGSLEPKLRELVKEHELTERVRFDTPVAVWEMTSAAATSHVGATLMRPVSINFKYTVTNKVFEYIQAGLPVILSDTVENRYLAEQYGIGLVIDEVTPTHIAQAITTLKNDPELYARLRENVLRASKIFCWEQEGLKLLDIYRQVAS